MVHGVKCNYPRPPTCGCPRENLKDKRGGKKERQGGRRITEQ